jgi:hypothetical protein
LLSMGKSPCLPFLLTPFSLQTFSGTFTAPQKRFFSHFRRSGY